MGKIEETIAAADRLAHVCVEIGGTLDVSGGESDCLVSLCSRCSHTLIDAAGQYWKAKGIDEDGMPPEDEPSKTVHVIAGVRYPEDATVNGEREDEDAPTMPFLQKDAKGDWNWDFQIEIETGRVVGWPQGMTANTWYKVCDECKVKYGKIDYYEYVPDWLAIDDEGYGDYVYLTIDENGIIKGWNKTAFEKWVRQIEKNQDGEDE